MRLHLGFPGARCLWIPMNDTTTKNMTSNEEEHQIKRIQILIYILHGINLLVVTKENSLRPVVCIVLLCLCLCVPFIFVVLFQIQTNLDDFNGISNERTAPPSCESC